MAHPRSLKTTHIWDVYQRQLFTLGYGLPLWDPEPQNYSQVLSWGSVIYPSLQGRYTPLFHSAKEANPENDYPQGHVKFERPPVIFGPAETIKRATLFSKSVSSEKVDASADANTGGLPVEAGAGFKFVCKSDMGAILVLEPPGITTYIQSKRRIVTYMRDHFDSWMELANSRFELDLREQDLLFVSGTTCTRKWYVAAFQNQSFRQQEGYLNLNLADLVTANVSVCIANETLSNPDFNYGPTQKPQAPPSPRTIKGKSKDTGEERANSELESPDQCIFIHYYKMKSRMWWRRPIRAAAGPHVLPDQGEDDDEGAVRMSPNTDSGESDIDESTQRGGGFDPVEPLLEYILENSEAKWAIACDRDVTAIFQERGIPEDIRASLHELKPPIDVDESGVGTLSVDVRMPESGPQELVGNVALDKLEDSPMIEREEQEAPPTRIQSSKPAVPPPNDDNTPMNPETGTHRREDKPWEPAANGHTGTVTSLAVSPDSHWVASGSDDTTIILWDIEDRGIRYKWERHGDTVWFLAFSPDNTTLASAGGEGRIMLWNVQNGELKATLEGRDTGTVHTVAWAPDGQRLASGSDDMTVRIWRAEGDAWVEERVLDGHSAMVTFARFSPDGRWLVSGGADYQCRLWRAQEDFAPHAVLEGHDGMIWMAEFDPGSTRVATASDDGTVRVWSAESGEALVILREHHGPVWAVRFSRDGRELVSASSDTVVKVCDSYSGGELLSLEGHDSMVNSAAFEPSGEYVVSASSDNTVKLWKRSDGQCVKTFNEHNDKVTQVQFTPDGQTLASGSDDGTVYIRPWRDYLV